MKYVWDGSLATGHAMIDEQHQQLFAAINGLLTTCEEGKGKEELKKSLDFLNSYTIKHFFEEETLQKKYKYPDYPNHQKYHEGFKETVRNLSHQLILSGVTEALVREVQLHVGDWLVTHIQVQDKKMAAYVKEQEAK
ncbi:hemerythrin family protein [Treponema primitia]|uniref:bacteriohemerythrin n=1 Tax=Treponema primitia TaxID=88058 RepID=UPI003980DA2B